MQVTISRMASNIEYLRKVHLFQGLEQEDLEKVAGLCTRKSIAKGETLFLEGDVGGSLFIIVGGSLQVERIALGGETVVLGIRRPGEVLGEMSVIDNAPRAAQAIALEPSRLLVLRHPVLKELLLREPLAAFAMLQTLTRRLREADNQLLNRQSKNITERLFDVLASAADDVGWARLPGSQAKIAETLGCSREAVNRALHELAATGRILREGTKLIKVLAADN